MGSGKSINPHIYCYYDKLKEKIIYIGKTNGRDKTYRTGSKILKRYILIYGYDTFDNRFDRNVIEYCSLNELDDKEEFYIKKYNTLKNGVNLTKGGRYDWKKHNFKPVLQYNLEGDFIKEWDSGIEAFEKLKLSNYDGISACCRENQKTSGGFIWRYKTLPIPKSITPIKRKSYKKNTTRIKYQAIEINGKKYTSITEAAKDLNWSFGKLNYKIKNNKITYKWLK